MSLQITISKGGEQDGTYRKPRITEIILRNLVVPLIHADHQLPRQIPARPRHARQILPVDIVRRVLEHTGVDLRLGSGRERGIPRHRRGAAVELAEVVVALEHPGGEVEGRVGGDGGARVGDIRAGGGGGGEGAARGNGGAGDAWGEGSGGGGGAAAARRGDGG
jgi:hypothetical protein